MKHLGTHHAAVCVFVGALGFVISCQPALATPQAVAGPVVNGGGSVYAEVDNASQQNMPSTATFNGSQPGATATQAGNPSTSTTTGAFAQNVFTYSFVQNFNPFQGDDDTDGYGIFYLTAPAGVTYSITDESPTVEPTGAGDNFVAYTAELLDDSTNTTLYLDSNGAISGSLSGTLNASDNYEFDAQASLSAPFDPILTYDPSISFTPGTAATSVTPEPSSILLLGSGLLGVAGVLKRRIA